MATASHWLRSREHPHIIPYFNSAEVCHEHGELVRKAFRAVSGGLPPDAAATIEMPEGKSWSNAGGDGDGRGRHSRRGKGVRAAYEAAGARLAEQLLL